MQRESPTSPSNQTLEQDNPHNPNFKKIKNQGLLSLKKQPLIIGSMDNFGSDNQHKSTLINYIYNGEKHLINSCAAESYTCGGSTSSGQSRAGPFVENYDDFVNYFNTNLHLHRDDDEPKSMPAGLGFVLPDIYQFLEVEDDHYKPRFSVNNQYEELEARKYHPIHKIGNFRGTFLDMMMDETSLFESSLEDGRLLKLIADEVLSDSQLFIIAAFSAKGAISISKLIKKLKKSSTYPFVVTRILSTGFLDIIVHEVARTVIQQCLIHFGSGPNKILFEGAIYHFKKMAVHKVGCRSLNEIINTIVGEQRTRLLNHIADYSVYLANDTYGNFVVQHILGLKNDYVTDRVLLVLRGHVVSLAQQKGGSHVVEKCMNSSNNGILFVVWEILETSGTAFDLAQDIFGNYVIQSALKHTKNRGFGGLYNSLVRALLPHSRSLFKTPGGKKVLTLIKDHNPELILQINNGMNVVGVKRIAV